VDSILTHNLLEGSLFQDQLIGENTAGDRVGEKTATCFFAIVAGFLTGVMSLTLQWSLYVWGRNFYVDKTKGVKKISLMKPDPFLTPACWGEVGSVKLNTKCSCSTATNNCRCRQTGNECWSLDHQFPV